MSTPTVTNVSVARDVPVFQPASTGARPRADRAFQDQSFVVTITASQGTAAQSTGEANHDFYHQRNVELRHLGQALRDGDAEGAQKAYDALVALGQNGPLKNGQAFHREDRAENFAALGQALAAGDLAGADAAFNRLAVTFGHDGSAVGGLIPAQGPLGPPVHIPPQGTLPPGPPTIAPPPGPPTLVPPPSATGGGPSGPPEIIIKVGGTPSTGHAGDLTVNLPPSSSASEEIQINFGNQKQTNGLSIDVHPQGSGGESVAINLRGNAANYQIILNLFQSASSDAQNGSFSLSA